MQSFLRVLALSVTHAHATRQTVSIPRLPIEAHGFNDISVWPQLLVKGVRWLKIDVGACTQSSCASFSTWNKVPGRGDESDCWTEGGATYCCLCLRGDTSSRPNLLDPFNTTYDLVAFLDDDSNQGILPTAIEDRLSIGLDFGAGPIFPGPGGCFFGCGSAPLLRKFVMSFNAVVQKRGLAIRGSNDVGFSGWFQDLDSRCSQGQCTPEDLLLQAVPWVSQAGSGWVNIDQPGSSRFQVLNDDYDGFESDCHNTAWRSVPSNATPWLWYEQTGQADYLKMINWWSTCSTLPPAQRADLSTQLIMVSNLAPEQMEVYSSPSGLTLRGENSQIDGANNGFVQPWIISVPSDTATSGNVCSSCDRFIILAAQPTGAGGTQVWLMPMTGRVAPGVSDALHSTILPTGADAVVNPVVAFFVSHFVGEDASTFSGAVLITVMTSNGNATSIIFDPSTASFDSPSSCGGEACTWSVSLLPGNALVSAATICNATIPSIHPPTLSMLPCIVVFAQASARGAGDLILSSSILSSGSSPLSTTVIAHGVSIDKGAGLTLHWNGNGTGFSGVLLYASKFNATLDNLVDMNEEDVLTALSNGSKYRLQSSGINKPDSFTSSSNMKARSAIIDYITRESHLRSQSKSFAPAPIDDGSRAYLYGSSIEMSFDLSTHSPSVSVTIHPSPGSSGPPPRLAVGALPRLSSIRLNNTVLILAMSTDGSCDTGIYVNNADMTRCGLPDPSFDDDPFYSVFQNVPYTVSYDYGKLSHWVSMLKNPGVGVNGRLGMCNKYVQHGKIETGLRPTASMFPWTVQYSNSSGADALPHVEVGLLAVHDATVPSVPPQLLLCGEATTKKGLVWDSWRIPQPWQLTSLE